MKRVLIIASLLLSVGCIKDDIAVCPSEQDNTTIIIPVDANLGEAIIKFKPEMEDILDMTLTRSGGEATRSGIPSTDEVLEILGAYSFERVFPVDPRHEERTREAGLHLWYIVRFDESENIGEAFARLSKLGEVDKLQCNRQLKRAYNPNSTVHTVSATRSGETESTKWPFNDNLISRQWCYANDGSLKFGNDSQPALAGCDAGCLEAWELCTGDEDIIVAVMDEAPMWSHPDLEANIWVNEGEELHAGMDADGNGYKDDKYGYRNFIDVQSFVDYFIINEFTSNYDAGWLSTYVYKDVDGLFKLCVWDFNSAFDNFKHSAMSPNTFETQYQPWYVMLTKCPDFTGQIIERYRELRQTYLSEEYLNQYIDETVAYLGDAIDRNFEKWGYTFEEENGLLYPFDRNPRSYNEALEQMRSYIHIRGEWMDENIDSLMQFASESKNKKNNEKSR